MNTGTLHCGPSQQAEVRVEKFYPDRGAASHRLRVDLQVTLYPGPSEDGQLIDLSGELHFGQPVGNGTFLASCATANGLPLDFRHTRGSTGCSLTFDLSSRVLATIESRREGRDLEIGVYLAGTASTGGRIVRSYLPLVYRVPASTWCDLLARMGYSDFLIFELPLKRNESDLGVRDALAHLARASRHMHSGQWDECVSACRLCVEAVEQLQPPSDPSASRSMERERLQGVFGSMKHYLSVAHHPKLHAAVTFDRAMAQTALMLSAAICSRYVAASAIHDTVESGAESPDSPASPASS